MAESSPGAPLHSWSGKPKGLVDCIKAAANFDDLVKALEPLKSWHFGPEQRSSMELALTHVRTTYNSPSEVLCAFVVSSINEWRVPQARVLVITTTAYYRVAVNAKSSKIDHAHRTPHMKVAGLERTPTGLRVYLTEADGRASLGQTVSSLFSRADVEHVREYLPTKPPYGWPGTDLLVETMSVTFQKSAELCAALAPEPFIVPPLLTPTTRVQGLAQRRASSAGLAATRKADGALLSPEERVQLNIDRRSSSAASPRVGGSAGAGASGSADMLAGGSAGEDALASPQLSWLQRQEAAIAERDALSGRDALSERDGSDAPSPRPSDAQPTAGKKVSVHIPARSLVPPSFHKTASLDEMLGEVDTNHQLVAAAASSAAAPATAPSASASLRKSGAVSRGSAGSSIASYVFSRLAGTAAPSPVVSSAPPLRAGLLFKRGQVNTAFKQRYIVLHTDGVLAWYSDAASAASVGKLSGSLMLTDGAIILTEHDSVPTNLLDQLPAANVNDGALMPSQPGRCPFIIVESDDESGAAGRVLCCEAASADEGAAWVAAMRDLLAGHPYRTLARELSAARGDGGSGLPSDGAPPEATAPPAAPVASDIAVGLDGAVSTEAEEAVMVTAEAEAEVEVEVEAEAEVEVEVEVQVEAEAEVEVEAEVGAAPEEQVAAPALAYGVGVEEAAPEVLAAEVAATVIAQALASAALAPASPPTNATLSAPPSSAPAAITAPAPPPPMPAAPPPVVVPPAEVRSAVVTAESVDASAPKGRTFAANAAVGTDVDVALLSLLARLVEERMQVELFLRSPVMEDDLEQAMGRARMLVRRRALLDTQIRELTLTAEKRGSLEAAIREVLL